MSSGALITLSSLQELQAFVSNQEFAVVCFSAKWCGPCKASHPQLVEMAGKLSGKYGSSLLQTAIVYEDVLGHSIHNYGIRAFPTYVLFGEFGRKEVGRVQGVNFAQVESIVESNIGARTAWKEQPGHSLGGSGSSGAGAPTASSMQVARLARLAALDKKKPAAESPSPSSLKDNAVADNTPKDSNMKADSSSTTTTPSDDNKNNAEKDKKTTATATIDTKMKEDEDKDDNDNSKMDVDTNENDDNKEEASSAAEADDPFIKDINAEFLKELTDSMGFPLVRAQKGLLYGNGGTVEGAVEWIMTHQDDLDIDEPVTQTSAGGTTMKSYKCNDCGKILSSMANLELHANKTGHSDFAESTEEARVLSKEEKEAKLREIKDLLASKRAEREEKERKDTIEREKRRRFQGQEMSKTREILEQEQRRRDADQKRREKIAAKKERERIKAELEKDKRERLANKGKLKSKLGVDGYNPDAIQYENDDGQGVDGAAHGNEESPETKHKKSAAKHMKIDECIQKISSYRAGGDGEKCLKLLLIYIRNVVDNPSEAKYRSINMEAKAYRLKIKPFVGAKQLLVDVGFNYEKADHLELGKDKEGNDTEEINFDLLQQTKQKLEQAIERY